MEEAIKLTQRVGRTKPYDISIHVMVELEKKFHLTRKREKQGFKVGDLIVVNHPNFDHYKRSGRVIWVSPSKGTLKVQIGNVELTIPAEHVLAMQEVPR